MNDPITALMAETEDNDDSMSLSFDLMTKASFTDRVHTDVCHPSDRCSIEIQTSKVHVRQHFSFQEAENE